MAIIFDPLISNLKVVDLSIPEIESQPAALDTALSALFPVFASKGRDNVITENKASSTIMSRYGDDFASFNKFGQANIMAIGITRSRGRAFICRLLPDDAKRSYVVFGVYVKEVSDIVQYERNDTVYSADRTSVISFGSAAYKLDDNGDRIPILIKDAPGDSEPATDVESEGVEIRLGTRDLESSDFDPEGYPTNYNAEVIAVGQEKFYPLFAFSYYGRGRGGNSFGFNIVRDTRRDKAMQDGRRYYMTCYEQVSSGGLSTLYPEPFYFSFNPDALFSPSSNVQEGLAKVYLNVDEDTGEDVPLQIYVYEENYTKLVTDLSPYKGETETVHDIDFINCIFKNGNPYGKIVKSATSIDITNTVLTLDGGTDGSLDSNLGHSPSEIEATRDELRQKFFRYEVDEDLLDEKICDIDIAPDCNYSPAVKKAMLRDFHQYRKDIKLLMDVGITRSYREAINTWTEYIPFINTECDYMVSVNGHSGILTDPSINSPYPVTYTYDYLKGMADNFATADGAFQMHAGTTTGRVKYFRPYWIGKKSLNNMFESLEELGMNYIERVDKFGNLMYGLESTQYMIGGQSKMTSDRNALVIGRAIRICHGVLINYKFDKRHIVDTMAAAQNHMNKELRLADIPKTIAITTVVYQTKEDKRSENAHCDILFEFPDYIKKFSVTIYALRPESALPPALAEVLS